MDCGTLLPSGTLCIGGTMNKFEMFMDALMPAIPALCILIGLIWLSVSIL